MYILYWTTMHFATTVRGADAYGSCAQTWKENEGNADRGKRAAGRVPDRLDALPEVRRHLDRQDGVGAGEVPHLRRQTEASGSRVLIRLVSRSSGRIARSAAT